MKPANLERLCSAVWQANTFQQKVELAKKVGEHFRLGGEDKFYRNLSECKTVGQIDRLVTNTMLKGEGMGVK